MNGKIRRGGDKTRFKANNITASHLSLRRAKDGRQHISGALIALRVRAKSRNVFYSEIARVGGECVGTRGLAADGRMGAPSL